jgi:hypothetical protein
MTALQGEALVGLHRSMTARARLAASAAQSTIGGKRTFAASVNDLVSFHRSRPSVHRLWAHANITNAGEMSDSLLILLCSEKLA